MMENGSQASVSEHHLAQLQLENGRQASITALNLVQLQSGILCGVQAMTEDEEILEDAGARSQSPREE